jgi:uncharacterized protein YerC
MNAKISKKVYEVFINSIKNTKSKEDVAIFLNDLLSQPEKIMLSKRVAAAFMLLEDKYTYTEISDTLKISFGTIAKVQSALARKSGGYNRVLGGLIAKKVINNALYEFLNLIKPARYTLSGERFRKYEIEEKRKREQPL